MPLVDLVSGLDFAFGHMPLVVVATTLGSAGSFVVSEPSDAGKRLSGPFPLPSGKHPHTVPDMVPHMDEWSDWPKGNSLKTAGSAPTEDEL